MSNLDISIVIPTFNRRKVLQKTISCLCQQTFSKERYEIIVIDDFSVDSTRQFLKEVKLSINYRYILNSENLGRARTRNKGIREAEGRYVLMIDDDIWASQTLIEEHFEEHQRHKGEIAVVGAIMASPEVPETAVNKYLNNHHIWCYNEMSRHEAFLPYTFCKTANLSLSRKLLLKIGLFNESFIHYGGEDTELGYRLLKNHIRLVFAKGAIGYHYHNETIDSVIEKAIENGRSVALYYKLYPEERREIRNFFSPFYHGKLTVRSMIYNAVKLFLFTPLGRMMNRIFIRRFNETEKLKSLVSKYFLPLLKAQYLRYGIKRAKYENRN